MCSSEFVLDSCPEMIMAHDKPSKSFLKCNKHSEPGMSVPMRLLWMLTSFAIALPPLSASMSSSGLDPSEPRHEEQRGPSNWEELYSIDLDVGGLLVRFSNSGSDW